MRGVSRVQCFVAAHIHNDISVEISRGTELNDGKGVILPSNCDFTDKTVDCFW